LVTDSLDSLPEAFDFIFLRNMLLYVTQEERPQIYRKVVNKLSPDGVLILSKAELPFFQHDAMDLVEIDGCFVLIKKSSRYGSWNHKEATWPITN
jgi:chemotaxis methyl-accepting protein methylase